MIRTTRRIDWTAAKATLCAAQSALEQSSTVADGRMQELFQERAKRLAADDSHSQSAANTSDVLIVRAGDETFGIQLRHVAQVFPSTSITPVPGAPDDLLGLANMQGEVRSVVGLRHLLALPGSPASQEETNRYILLLRQHGRYMGLQVEEIDGVRKIAVDQLNDDEEASDDKRAGYVMGMTHDKVIMLRIDGLFEC